MHGGYWTEQAERRRCRSVRLTRLGTWHDLEESDSNGIRCARWPLSSISKRRGLNWSARWYQADGALTPSEMASALVRAILAGITPRPAGS